MTRNLTYLLGMIIAILAGIFLYLNLCSECGNQVAAADTQKVQEEIVPPKEPDATSLPFSFKDGEYAFEVQDNFNFNLSSASFIDPLSTNVGDGIESLKNYLSQNTDKVINITGLYKSDETNTTAFPNLGVARANIVKNYFVSKGISSSQTNTFGSLMDDFVPLDGILLGPITYEIGAKAADSEDKLKALYDDIKANPLILYFNSGEASINLTPEQREKIAKISRYLDKVDGATCRVVGHTDNTGSRTTNIQLGLERADFAMAYLIRNGIPAAKIKTSSEGPDAPIASNATEERRSKNRRTVVTLN
jgi:outer membrane protein OmpA-like peptidoglycan-associated protein